MTHNQYLILQNLKCLEIKDLKTQLIIQVGENRYELKDIVSITAQGTLAPKIVFIADINEPR